MSRSIALILALIAVAAARPNRASLDWRIVGGKTAEDGQFPFQISLRAYGSHNCGGSVINNQWIVTAAHCLQGWNKKDLSIVAGSNKLNSGGQTYQVAEIIYHEDYDSWNIVNDVGLIRVEGEIELNEKVQPIELNEEEIGGGVDVILSGWGRTSYPGDIPNDLQFLGLKSLTVEDCQNGHPWSSVYDSEICTYTKEGEGACHGDSGGPLTYNGKLAGIVSWGSPCARGYPDVFTRVSSFLSWIREKSQSQ